MKQYIRTESGEIMIQFSEDTDDGSSTAFPLKFASSLEHAVKNLVTLNSSQIVKRSESLAMVMI